MAVEANELCKMVRQGRKIHVRVLKARECSSGNDGLKAAACLLECYTTQTSWHVNVSEEYSVSVFSVVTLLQ
jgi:hypothetical protein